MNIVVTNDDGLHTPGIWALAEALVQVGDVTVVAPDREQSGVGLGITLHHPVKVYEAIPRVEGIKAYAVEGTPADSVLLAAQELGPSPVDLVVSGINEGANTGIYVMMSGTVGAAVAYQRWRFRWLRSRTLCLGPPLGSAASWPRCSKMGRWRGQCS